VRPHLTPAQLIDVAEGAVAESGVPHLSSCAECRRQLADLRAVMTAVVTVDPPDPSPLFWDHLAARVNGAIAEEGGTVAATSRDGAATLFHAIGASIRSRAAVAAAFPLVVAAVALAVHVRSTPPAGAVPERAVVAEEAAVPSIADDPALALVADLATDLDWDASRAAGVMTPAAMSEELVNDLTPGERLELRRLLQGELSSSRRGA
jgi:hypothetical protein